MGRSPACLFLSRILDLHRTELVHLKGPVVEADPLLTVENGARRGQLYEPCRKEHHRREQKKAEKSSSNVHNPLYRSVKYVRQRHMADMDHRQSLKILHIGNRRYNIIVIRNEFGMNAGFLTDCHD